MSTNKTEHHALHAWEPGDDFLLSEINENFAAVDGVLPGEKRLRTMTGVYQGTGWKERQPLILPFAPEVLVLECHSLEHSYHTIFCMPGQEGTAALSGDRLTVTGLLNLSPTDSLISPEAQGKYANPYHYIAFGWEE